MKLTTKNVETTIDNCLFDENEDQVNAVEVKGIVHDFKFHPDRLKTNKENICSMLSELPDEFHASLGGGWSFLNMCQTKEGEQWTGMHITMESLMVLGLAIGKIKYCMEREMWDVLLGGMPYFMVGELDETQ